MIMRTVGRSMQIMALICLPVSMILEITGALGRSFGLSEMLIMLVFGTLLFLTGRVIEGYARQ